MKDRGLYWDNMSRKEFLEHSSPSKPVILNPERECYSSDEEYAEALLEGVYGEAMAVRPDLEDDSVALFEGDSDAVAVESERELMHYRLRPGVENVAAEVFNSMVVGSGTRNVESVERYSVDELEVFLLEVLGVSD